MKSLQIIQLENEDYLKDRQFGDQCQADALSWIITKCSRDASFYEDTRNATDLVMPSGNIAVRVRRHCYMSSYGNEFTLRCRRASGAETELAKIMQSDVADLLFYGFSCECGRGIAQAFLGDLSVFRRWYHWRIAETGVVPGRLHNNPDGKSSFRSFMLRDMPIDFFIASDVPGFPARQKAAV